MADKPSSDTVFVRTSSGRRHPFLRGIVTHDLMLRGLSFDEAYAAARALRDRLAGRDEVSTSELSDLVEAQLAEMLPEERLARLEPRSGDRRQLSVVYHGEPQPFSRGLLARSIHAAGVDLDRAYRLVTRLQGDLRRERVDSLPSEDLADRAAELLERHEGAETAGRYRMVRSIRRLPRPLVLYLGGATGTGKSTLALDLAPLLRIYRINATDTIRQVMRMVFAPAILPALHHSSYELPRRPDGARGVSRSGPWHHREDRRQPAGEDWERRLVEEFDEQATRVCVGVRAVVERAVLENMSVLVEGVHLAPPLVPFPDLEGSAYQVSLLLTTLDEEAHRSRFLARDRLEGRGADSYLEHFGAIRHLQELMIGRAERYGVQLLETTDRDSTLDRALRVVTTLLEQEVPDLRAGPRKRAVEVPPTLLLFIDGLGDRPVRALSGRTALEAARLPTFDRLAREGRLGLADPVEPGVVPDTAAGSLAIFGQPPRAIRRGPVEAVGAGIDLAPEDVALRGNLATLDAEGQIIDRRAGRIREGTEELAAALDRLRLTGDRGGNRSGGRGDPWSDYTVRVRMGTEHRLAVVLQGEGLSPAVVGSDPGDGAPPGPPLAPRPVDPAEDEAVRTARLLGAFEERAREVLDEHPVNRARRERGEPVANAVLTRGAGRIHRLLRIEQGGAPLDVACVSGDRTVLGIASLLGARTVTSERMTANLDTDLGAKLAAAAEALGRDHLVVVHVKGADIAAHDIRPDRKVAFLEELDSRLGELLEAWDGPPLQIAVASDHATLSESGQHSADPVPVLMWGEGVEADGTQRFTEREAAEGGLGRFPLQGLLARLFRADR